MKTAAAFITSALLATSALAAPEPQGWKYGGRGGKGKHGWGGGRGKWDGKGDYGKGDDGVIPFTSTYHVVATPEQVVNTDGQYTGGLKGAKGYYDFGINSDLNLICYYIKLEDVTGDYQSAANTATHVHEAPKGMAGPPRLAFPNPQPESSDEERISAGCLQGPFMTGIEDDNGVDTGVGFHVSEIEANPSGFFCDAHTEDAVPGAVRGQLA